MKIKTLSHDQWAINHLHEHLQEAVNLELWTIPFYMSAMYSIKDKSSPVYQLIRTVLNQEMLHLQSAANIANAYGLSPSFSPPVYKGKTIPYLDFSQDPPETIKPYCPYTAEIGGLDEQHINAMCLIEIPDYETEPTSLQFCVNAQEYGSIGAFYEALRIGLEHLKDHIRGGVRQVDFFSAFYRNTPDMKITNSGSDGMNQVNMLINLITNQGEGVSKTYEKIPPAFQNTADDTAPEEDHFAKFNEIKNSTLPVTFKAKPISKYTKEDKELEAILVRQFSHLMTALEGLFKGDNPENFFPVMASVGGAIRNCWEHGVTPKFS
ncbi:hypothetical protein GZ77_00260 [Endozoicomonas montiporae]|uniref:Iminophenyl-pyruvate dimer synthase domain-containing protein n=2 Tax=Endozoicomonas montiporae TaxID=1027273 RepID=A0A081N9P9_9GAMM|nr:ferritin-like domain-containing protein [Endozoicomonas montiporae]AMO55026.1 hypothetical protein EZMO1_0801 [Endozoicomonas montiporae CL-33]KEQ15172.1 hypothetical protein GZ77_00260 [Endozoicomonas montiporae]